jgi:hypothetical protein
VIIIYIYTHTPMITMIKLTHPTIVCVYIYTYICMFMRQRDELK